MKKLLTILGCIILFNCCLIAQDKNINTLYPNYFKKDPEKRISKFKSQGNYYLQKNNPKQMYSFYLESFEGSFPPTAWTKQSPDGGTGWAQCANGTTPLYGWSAGTQDVPPGGGNFVAYCTWNTGGTTSNDQWLISPQFSVTSGDSLKFYLWRFAPFQDTVQVLLSTASSNIADFTTTLLQVDTTVLTPMCTWKKFAINLTPYAGQNIYIAFREKVSNNIIRGAYIALDLVSMGTPSSNDVASISVDEPANINPGTINPKASVINYGTTAQTFDVTMTISGGYSSTKTVTNLSSLATQQITFDPWNATIGDDTITVYTQLSGDAITSNDTISRLISVKHLTKVYCYIATYDPLGVLPKGPAYTYLQDPSQVYSIADQSNEKYVASGTWGGLNKWYGVAYDSNLVTLDTSTGARTIIGNVSEKILGISYDYKTNNLYGIGWDGTNSSLYSINNTNGQMTLIGQTGAGQLINLACDSSGNLYSVCITNDMLYSINKNTGIATTIGAIGFDANFAQDMEFNRYTNICYMAAYNADSSRGELRTIDVATGNTTLLGVFAGGVEITGFAIPYKYNPSDIQENIINRYIKVYPNPVKNILNIYSEQEKIEKIKLFNTLGQLIIFAEVNDYVFNINTEKLSEGTYYIQIETKASVITENVIIDK